MVLGAPFAQPVRSIVLTRTVTAFQDGSGGGWISPVRASPGDCFMIRAGGYADEPGAAKKGQGTVTITCVAPPAESEVTVESRSTAATATSA